MKKINWENLLELIVFIISLVLTIVCYYKTFNSNIPLNYLLCALLFSIVCLGSGYDILDKVNNGTR